MSSIGVLLKEAALRLQACSPSPRTDAEYLLMHVTGRDRTWLRLHDDAELPPSQHEAFRLLLARREKGEPVAYLTGERGFWSLDVTVSPATLIPRADTELLVEMALEKLPLSEPRRVLDLGTGSGIIALAIKKERPRCHVTAVDASEDALQVAAANAAKLQLEIGFVHSNWYAALEGQVFDMVVANPPYIAADDPHLGQGDLRFEPLSALVAGEQGLADLRRIVVQAPRYLSAGGWLMLEHGFGQAEAVQQLLRDNGFIEVATRQDLGGQPRATQGRLAPFVQQQAQHEQGASAC